MASESIARRRRRRRIAGAAPNAAAAPLPTLPDEILESIFLLLDNPADLARAASACTSFRHVATARPFLRRFGSLHTPPPLLGLLLSGPGEGFCPAEPPNRSAAAARVLARAADFTFSFLPDSSPGGWVVRDARGGRVLLSRPVSATAGFDYVMVCDPLHCRYVRVPSVPDELVASIPRRDRIFVVPFLAPDATENADAESASFSVIRTCQLGHNKVVAFFFTSGSGRWRATTPYMSSSNIFPIGCIGFQRCYALGCFHWMISSTASIVLDTRDMKFSTINLPPTDDLRHRAIFETGEGRLGLIAFSDGGRSVCEVWQQNSGVVDDTQDWQLYKTIPLPNDAIGMDIQGEADNYLLLRPIEASFYIEFPESKQYLVLDLKTLLFEGIFSSDVGYEARSGHLYVGFPPPLAPPSI
ncbi:unnamed protein product [Urochloa humidicola]